MGPQLSWESFAGSEEVGGSSPLAPPSSFFFKNFKNLILINIPMTARDYKLAAI